MPKPEAIKCTNEKCVAIFTTSTENKTQPTTPDEKSCANDTDCEIKYNVKINGECSAGCFNINAEIDEWCNYNRLWEAFPSTQDCICENNQCEMKKY